MLYDGKFTVVCDYAHTEDGLEKLLSTLRPLAKGRLIPVQLKALFEGGKDSLYYELSKRENELAIKLAESVVKAGYKLWLPHQTNQVFVIVPNDKIDNIDNIDNIKTDIDYLVDKYGYNLKSKNLILGIEDMLYRDCSLGHL